jgi:hypothetical protein
MYKKYRECPGFHIILYMVIASHCVWSLMFYYVRIIKMFNSYVRTEKEARFTNIML